MASRVRNKGNLVAPYSLEDAFMSDGLTNNDVSDLR